MKRLLVVVVVLAFAVPCLAQTVQPPKPGPEHEKLEIWVGDWTFEGEVKATPLGAAAKVTGKVTARRALGRFFVESRGEEEGPGGTLQWVKMDAYDPATKRFMWYGFSSDGSVGTVTCTFEGNTVTQSGIQVAGDKQVQIRGTTVFAPDLMSFVEKREMSLDGKTWVPFWETKATKTKPSPK